MEDEDLGRRVAELLGERTIATAESCTAGRVAEVLASVEKATEFFRGGIVAYQDEIKRGLLDVAAESVISAAAAAEMAAGAARLFDADVTVSTTGVAGDEAADGVPPGTVFIATSVDGEVGSSVHRFDGSPEEVCDQARRQALVELIEAMDCIPTRGLGSARSG